MRPPVRAVGDDHVDRPEVERRRRRGRPVLMARGLPAGRGAGAWGAAAARGAGPGPAGGRAARPPRLPPPLPSAWRPAPAAVPSLWHGGHRGGAPPLPIPNRAVKPARADGTARDGRESRSPPPCAPGPLDPGAFFLPRRHGRRGRQEGAGAARCHKRCATFSPVRFGLASFTFSGWRRRASYSMPAGMGIVEDCTANESTRTY